MFLDVILLTRKHDIEDLYLLENVLQTKLYVCVCMHVCIAYVCMYISFNLE